MVLFLSVFLGCSMIDFSWLLVLVLVFVLIIFFVNCCVLFLFVNCFGFVFVVDCFEFLLFYDARYSYKDGIAQRAYFIPV